MKRQRRRLDRVLAMALALASADTPLASAAERLDGFNVVTVPEHPFGSPGAQQSLAQARRLGARTVAVVLFLWQAEPTNPGITRGIDLPDDALRQAIRQARALGFTVLVKPQVWVPGHWAGAVTMQSEADWRTWFQRYEEALSGIARVAAEEHAQALAIGTELEQTTHRAEWNDVIAAARLAFPGTLLYVAHNADEAETVPFWGALDAAGVTLYPPLGRDRDSRLTAMRAAAARLDALAERTGKPIIVGEIGLRSAEGATDKPWESAEERASPPDPLLQAEVLADWMAVLRRPSINGVLVWRWFTDPASGGPTDTDFTVQGKPAEGVLLCAWTELCAR